jgi:hypothetical protein
VVGRSRSPFHRYLAKPLCRQKTQGLHYRRRLEPVRLRIAMAVSEPWWTNLDVPGLRYVRTVLHHHKMDLVLTERGVDHETAHFAVAIETPTGSIGSLCAVPWAKGALALPPDLTVILQLLLTTAAQDVAAALPLRNATSPVTSDSPARRSTRDGYESLIGNSAEMQSLYVMI